MPVPDKLFAEMPSLSDSALRSVLALIRLSFRFEPEKSAWVKPDRTFSRAEIEEENGLSGQGTRNGLRELAKAGYVSIDTSGRNYEYTLEMKVPDRRYTYLPTALLEEAPGLNGTELRVLLTVLRATWGWTSKGAQEESPEKSSLKHRRWAQLSTAELAGRTGRSESAVKKAAQRLNGRYLGRRRPTSGAYYYRFLPEALFPEDSREKPGKSDADEDSRPKKPAVRRRVETSILLTVPNDLPPGRQRSGPRVLYKESFFERAEQESQRGAARPSVPGSPTTNEDSAVLEEEKNPEEVGVEVSITGFSEKKRALGQKLANVGVWPRRIPELLRRFSAERIEENFEYYCQEAQKREIFSPGAWLNDAITEGYATSSGKEGRSDVSEGESHEGESQNGDESPGIPTPGTKVSETRKQALIRSGKAENGDFERFKRFDDPSRKQHFFRLEQAR